MEDKKRNNKKEIMIIIGVIALFIFLVIKFKPEDNISNQQAGIAGQTISSQQVKIVPLNQEERQKVGQILLSSQFIKDMPAKESVSLIFYTFEGNQKVWQDGFLIGKNKLLSEGTPSIQLTLPSRYISEFNSTNLCEIIKKAQQNGDLGFYSEYSKVKLFIKFASMLKYKECFGI